MAGSGGSYWSTLSQDPSWAWLSREDSRPVQGTEDETQLGASLTGACRIQNSKLSLQFCRICHPRAQAKVYIRGSKEVPVCH
ncbi:unnamed protein product [Symbiodinium sp. CCMP2592]|nr:unnamed protein product [Symbiodinium sp. CCMP2592]